MKKKHCTHRWYVQMILHAATYSGCESMSGSRQSKRRRYNLKHIGRPEAWLQHNTNNWLNNKRNRARKSDICGLMAKKMHESEMWGLWSQFVWTRVKSPSGKVQIHVEICKTHLSVNPTAVKLAFFCCLESCEIPPRLVCTVQPRGATLTTSFSRRSSASSLP